MFLHSVTLADICTMDSKAVTMNAWQGCQDPSRGTEFSWARAQTKLPDRYWTLWQKALLKCFLVSGSSRDLRDKLGRWSLVPPRWRWYSSLQEDRLYKKEQWMWRAYPALRVRTSSRLGPPKYRHLDEVIRLCPAGLLMASVYPTKHSVTKEATLELLDIPVPSDNRPASIQRLRSNRPGGFNWAITEMSVDDKGGLIAAALQARNAVAMSDGSFKDSQGTAASVIDGTSSKGIDSLVSTLYQGQKTARAHTGANS